MHAGVARGVRVGSHRANLEAERAAEEEPGDDRDGNRGEEDADVALAARDDRQRGGGDRFRARER